MDDFLEDMDDDEYFGAHKHEYSSHGGGSTGKTVFIIVVVLLIMAEIKDYPILVPILLGLFFLLLVVAMIVLVSWDIQATKAAKAKKAAIEAARNNSSEESDVVSISNEDMDIENATELLSSLYEDRSDEH